MPEFETPASFHSLLHPKPAALITCAAPEGRVNIISIAWITPLSLKPRLLGFAIRTDRFSYAMIAASHEFVVNIPPYELEKETLYCGRHSGADVDKFKETGLTAAPARCVKAPRIAECIAFVECRLWQEYNTGDHQFLVGEVLEAYVREGLLDDECLFNLEKVHPLLHVGKDTFSTTK